MEMIMTYAYAIIGVVLILNWIVEARLRRKYKADTVKEITAGLQHRVVIIEGRCAKCGDRIPDELLTRKDLDGPSSAIN